MANLPAYDRVLQIVNDNASFFFDWGARTTASRSPKLAAFMHEVWDPWYGRVLLVTSHSLTESQQALFAKNVAEQLGQIRDDAGYRYQLPVYYAPDRDIDASLAKIAEEAGTAVEMYADRARAAHPRQVYARR